MGTYGQLDAHLSPATHRHLEIHSLDGNTGSHMVNMIQSLNLKFIFLNQILLLFISSSYAMSLQGCKNPIAISMSSVIVQLLCGTIIDEDYIVDSIMWKYLVHYYTSIQYGEIKVVEFIQNKNQGNN